MEPTLREILGPKKMMREIAEEICRESGLTLRDLIAPSRQPSVAKVRQEAYLRCYEAGHTQAQIGTFFDRDESTVWYGVRVAQKRRCAEFSPHSTYSCRDRSNTMGVTCAILGE